MFVTMKNPKPPKCLRIRRRITVYKSITESQAAIKKHKYGEYLDTKSLL